MLYTLTAADAAQINRRRTDGVSIRERIDIGEWSVGAQAHIGQLASEGEIFPLMVVTYQGDHWVAGQVFLAGNDVLWVTDRTPGEGPGFWKVRP